MRLSVRAQELLTTRHGGVSHRHFILRSVNPVEPLRNLETQRPELEDLVLRRTALADSDGTVGLEGLSPKLTQQTLDRLLPFAHLVVCNRDIHYIEQGRHRGQQEHDEPVSEKHLTGYPDADGGSG